MAATNTMPSDPLAARVEALGLQNFGELVHEVETPYGLRGGRPGRSCVL